VTGPAGAAGLAGAGLSAIQQKVASYSLILGDVNTLIEVSNAGATTITIPLNSSQPIPIRSEIHILMTNTGIVTIAGTGGVTVNGTPGLKLRAQYSMVTLIKRAADVWVAVGDLSA
jgi:hypothetical protein